MKNYLILFTFLTFGMTVLYSCKNDDNSNNNDNQTSADQTIEIIQTGSWRISSFIDSGDDDTSDFSGFTFTFNSDGSLVAVNGNNTVNGTWSVTDDSNNSSSDDDGNSTDDDNFNIFFNVAADNDFEDLNDDWDFLSVSETTIGLTDVSGGNGGTDILIFQRN